MRLVALDDMPALQGWAEWRSLRKQSLTVSSLDSSETRMLSSPIATKGGRRSEWQGSGKVIERQ